MQTGATNLARIDRGELILAMRESVSNDAFGYGVSSAWLR